MVLVLPSDRIEVALTKPCAQGRGSSPNNAALMTKSGDDQERRVQRFRKISVGGALREARRTVKQKAKVSTFHPPNRPGWREPPYNCLGRATRIPNGSGRRHHPVDCDGAAGQLPPSSPQPVPWPRRNRQSRTTIRHRSRTVWRLRRRWGHDGAPQPTGAIAGSACHPQRAARNPVRRARSDSRAVVGTNGCWPRHPSRRGEVADAYEHSKSSRLFKNAGFAASGYAAYKYPGCRQRQRPDKSPTGKPAPWASEKLPPSNRVPLPLKQPDEVSAKNKHCCHNAEEDLFRFHSDGFAVAARRRSRDG